MYSWAKKAYCVNPTDIDYEVRGKSTDADFSLITFSALPCDRPDCASIAEVEQLNVYFFNPVYTLDFSNKDRPASPFPQSRPPIKPSFGTSQMNAFLMKQNIIRDSNGLFFGETTAAKFVDIGERLTGTQGWVGPRTTCFGVEPEKCEALAYWQYSADASVLRIQRSYKGLFETLGEIGGIKELIHWVFLTIYSWYNSRKLKKFMSDRIFNFSEDMESMLGCLGGGQKPALPGKRSKQEQKLAAELHKLAEDSVDSGLDAISILKDLNKMKLLIKLLLPPAAVRLEPLVTLIHRKAETVERGAFHSPVKIQPYAADNLSFEDARHALQLQPATDPIQSVTEMKPGRSLEGLAGEGRLLDAESQHIVRVVHSFVQRSIEEGKSFWKPAYEGLPIPRVGQNHHTPEKVARRSITRKREDPEANIPESFLMMSGTRSRNPEDSKINSSK